MSYPALVMPQTILVTGGAGYIGSHTAITLIEQGHSVVIADNLCNSSPKAVEAIRRLTGVDVAFVEADLTDTDQTKSHFRCSSHRGGHTLRRPQGSWRVGG